MKKRVLALSIGLIVLMLGGGIPAMAGSPAFDEIVLNQADNGRTVTLNGSQVLVLNLESNPSTGYSWAVQSMDGGVLQQVGDYEWIPSSGLLGAPGTQVLRFAGAAEGQTTLTLNYARSWETAIGPQGTFSIQVQVRQPAPVNLPVVEEDTAPAAVRGGISALPTSFNWCDQGKCTAVRNQGNCGSCWAFGTVGPFESAILIADNSSKDLSEQYLVSCNTDGWGCNGGWFAHDYHEWKIPPGEPAAGAVYESDFRYTATDAPCDSPYTHNEVLSSWAYVGSSNNVPAVDAIKTAIYTYGPVGAAVCVNSTFQAYSGGVYAPTKRCTSINHAIVLTGWDDAGGYWILRNSWGNSWGEQGYMRIAYGANQVGYAANYVEYGGGTPPPPSGTMHVSAIDMSYVKKSSSVTVYTTVTIVDANNVAVSGATVSIETTLPSGVKATGSGTTGTNGKVTFSVRTKLTGTYLSKVTNVTHASYTYDPGANVITQKSLVVP